MKYLELIKNAPLRLLIICGLGFIWFLLSAYHQLSWTLPPELIGKNLIIKGIIASIPETKNNGISFRFLATDSFNKSPLPPLLQKEQTSIHLRLSWRNPPKNLRVGDEWQLYVRLKPPRGFWDEGVFDYQAWLFSQGIRATGYVLSGANNHLTNARHVQHPINHLRAKIAASINTSLHNQSLAGLISALAVGIRDNITEPQWTVLRGTGTNHLFAIAGLHIGFVSSITYFLINFFWRRLGKLPLYVATPQAAALAALIMAIFYSALAGFALPTQRAIIMIAVFLIATLWRKHLPTWTAWAVALLLILIIEPLAALSDSFWLSFGAVAVIIFGVAGRLKQDKKWLQWARIQWVLTLGLIPLSLWFFHQASFTGFIANTIAIPWVGFIVLPLCLLGDIAWFIAPKVAGFIWLSAEWCLAIIWPLLTYFAAIDWAQWFSYINHSLILFCGIIAVILLLAPRGFPARWLGFVWLAPLLFWVPATPKTGEIWFSLLDVGQGLSAVVRTTNHTLIYDTGPSYSGTFDTGNAVLAPFLQSNFINTIDTLIITNSKIDHIGGTRSLLQQIPVKQVLTTVPYFFKTGFSKTCSAGQNWQWDGVKFQILYPPLNNAINSNSCVLRISTGAKSILLTGDINSKDQKYLLQQPANLLATTILLAPHYGARNSSLPEFVQATHPQFVLFSTGFLNKYHWPNAGIIKNYQQAGAKIYNTAEAGEITFKLTGSDASQAPEIYKKQFWDY